MSLRWQLLLVSLLLLALPWAAYRSVGEIETTLLAAQRQTAVATANAVAQALTARPELFFRPSDVATRSRPLYAAPLFHPVQLDGYDADWEVHGEPPRHAEFGQGLAPGTRLSFRLGYRGGRLYLLIDMADAEVIRYRPDRQFANGDRLLLRVRDVRGQRRHFLVLSEAPGDFHAREVSDPSLREPGGPNFDLPGHRLQTPDGQRLEMALPLELAAGGLDLFYIDVAGEAGRPSWQGSADLYQPEAMTPVIVPSAELGLALAPLSLPGYRLRVVDAEGWLRAERDRSDEPVVGNEAEISLADALWYRLLLRFGGERHQAVALRAEDGRLGGALLQQALAGAPASDWRRDSGNPRVQVTAVAPVVAGARVVGAVIAELDTELVGALTGQALGRVFYVSMLAVAVAVVALLAFATLLSWRVRRLRDAAESAIAADGSISAGFPRATAADELGDLSRSFADLLDELREYTEYLRRLAATLAHELRTPLAVVKSSLDNAQQAAPGEDVGVYLARAREGSERLARLLDAMAEARRVEQALSAGGEEVVDWRSLLEEAVAGYREIYPDRSIELQLPQAADGCTTLGQPDLLAQLLDKLVGNAVTHSAAGARVSIDLRCRPGVIDLAVGNSGSSLPAQLRGRIFDPLVSIPRQGPAEAGANRHLGLGLYIARLIVERHGGRISARDLPGAAGVELRVVLPRRLPE